MYKYAKFGQNIPYRSRVLSISIKVSRSVGWMLGATSSTFAENVKMNICTNFDPNIPYGSIGLSVFTYWPRPQQNPVHKIGFYACQWLGNGDLHTYAKVEQNIPCGSRVILLKDGRTESHTGMMLGEAWSSFCITVAGQF